MSGPAVIDDDEEIPLFREHAGDGVPGFLTALGMLTWRKLVSGKVHPRPLPLYLRPPAAVPAEQRTVLSGMSG